MHTASKVKQAGQRSAGVVVLRDSPGRCSYLLLRADSHWNFSKVLLETGGSLSWVNPAAWSEDAARTGRILAGEVVIVGGVVVAAVAGSGPEVPVGRGRSMSIVAPSFVGVETATGLVHDHDIEAWEREAGQWTD